MECVYCKYQNTKVVDKRDGDGITRRRRECLKCGKRFTTYERPESIEIIVVKKDGRREPYLREKLTRSIVISCQKRPVSADEIEKLVDFIEAKVKSKKTLEVSSKYMGQLVLKKLKKLDDVAYVRFASVYKNFENLDDFESELNELRLESEN